MLLLLLQLLALAHVLAVACELCTVRTGLEYVGLVLNLRLSAVVLQQKRRGRRMKGAW